MKQIRFPTWFLPSAFGLLLANGCLATLQQNLDLVLSPDAFANALVLPFSPMFPAAAFLARWFWG